jgi:hypothetical protein
LQAKKKNAAPREQDGVFGNLETNYFVGTVAIVWRIRLAIL